MLKRILIFQIIIVVFFGLVSCTNHEQEQRMLDLENQAAVLKQQNEALAKKINEIASPPQMIMIIDKTIKLNFDPEIAWVTAPKIWNYEGYLKIPLKPGNRIVAEVNTELPKYTSCRLLDPYGNKVIKSSYDEKNIRFTQQYPWKFSFTATTSGEYEFKIDTGGYMPTESILGKVRIEVYDK